MSGRDDDARLYSCMKKYEEIVKQVLLLDELTESFDPKNRLSKKKKKKNSGSSSNVEEQESFDQVIVQTITKFLDDLNTVTHHDSTNPKPSDHR